MRTALYNLLSNDATFMSHLQGGFYDAAEVGEISRQNTPHVYEVQNEMVTCCLMRFGAATRLPPYKAGSRETVSFYFYDRMELKYTNIILARQRLYRLLHDQRIAPEGAGLVGSWRVLWTDDITGQIDDSLNPRALLEVSRFECLNLRQL